MARLTIADDGNHLRFEVSPRHIEKCLRVPGLGARKDKDTGADYWHGRISWSTMVALGSEFRQVPDFEVDPALEPFVEWFLTAERYSAWLGTQPHVPYSGTGLFPFQTVGVRWLSELRRVILADEMGTGKTVQALVALDKLDDVFKRPALVVCPTSMLYVWAEEAATWCPDRTPYVVAGTKLQQKKAVEAAREDPHALVIVGWGLIAKVSKLDWYGGAKPLTALERSDGPLQSFDFGVCIFDEAHRAKDPGAKRSMAAKQLRRGADYVWALTGTPLANVPGDAWALLNLVDPAEWTSRSKFNDRWVFQIETDYGLRPVGWDRGNRAEIDRHLSRYVLRRRKTDVLPDLPDKTYQVRRIELAGKQKTAYNALRKDQLLMLDGGVLSATNPLELLTYSAMAASATPVITDGKITALGTPSNKLDTLLDIMSEMDPEEQFVVFAESRKLLDLVAVKIEREGETFIRIDGTVDARMRAASIQVFQEGRARIALVTLGAGAEGITLTAAQTAIFLQRSYSLVTNRQAEDRIHRAGQTGDHVTIIDIVSIGTVDEDIIKAVLRKGELLDNTLDQAEQIRGMLS